VDRRRMKVSNRHMDDVLVLSSYGRLFVWSTSSTTPVHFSCSSILSLGQVGRYTCDLLVIILTDDQIIVDPLNNLLNRLQRRSQSLQRIDFLSINHSTTASKHLFMRIQVRVRHLRSNNQVVGNLVLAFCCLLNTASHQIDRSRTRDRMWRSPNKGSVLRDRTSRNFSRKGLIPHFLA
jgi:hypothetical protein